MPFSGTENITLIGMPGVGKSTLGVVLAKVLNLDFLDTDLLIQQRARKTLQEIIDEEGRERFVARENNALSNLSCERTLISTGGSAVYSAEAMEHLRALGPIIYLKTTTEDLASHLGTFESRGVISLKNDVLDLASLHAERAPLYERYADVAVDIAGLTVREALSKILAALDAYDDRRGL